MSSLKVFRAALALALATVAVGSCGGPDRPADDPTRGTGGNGSDFVPEMPNPTPVPEPAPMPGGPDVTPTGALGPSPSDNPGVMRDLRGPLIAAALPMPIDGAPIGSELASGGMGTAGRPGSGAGGFAGGAGARIGTGGVGSR